MSNELIRTIEQGIITYFNAQADEYVDCDAFMQPQLVGSLSKEEMPEGIGFEDIPLFWARLSAPGYLDCTEWTPINNNSDVDSFYEMFFM